MYGTQIECMTLPKELPIIYVCLKKVVGLYTIETEKSRLCIIMMVFQKCWTRCVYHIAYYLFLPFEGIEHVAELAVLESNNPLIDSSLVNTDVAP